MEGLMYLAKVNINYSLKNKEIINKKIKGILNNNKIIFDDDNYKIIIEMSDKNLVIKRQNEEIDSEMNFNEKSCCKYFLKQYNKYVTFDIELIRLNVSLNDIEIIYKIEDEQFEFVLHFEVI